MTPAGFPHTDIPGSKTVCVSPRLIAACHVLHRLLVPRHPPCALSSLTGKFTKVLRLYLPSVSYSIVKDRARRASVAGDTAGLRPSASRRSYGLRGRSGRAKPSLESGGDSGARTRSLRLAKPALSQLSYIPDWGRSSRRVAIAGAEAGAGQERWWAWVDSNHPPHAYQACALTN